MVGGLPCEDTDQKQSSDPFFIWEDSQTSGKFILTSLEPWFFHPKMGRSTKSYRSVGLSLLNNSDTASHGSWYRVSSQ